MPRSRLLPLFALLALAAGLLVGCQDRTRISAILNDTDAYAGRDVRIAGTVTKAYGADLVVTEAGAYQVDDGTGKIWVLTKTGLPREGQRVAVKGTVSSGLKLGGESLGAVLREVERRTE